MVQKPSLVYVRWLLFFPGHGWRWESSLEGSSLAKLVCRTIKRVCLEKVRVKQLHAFTSMIEDKVVVQAPSGRDLADECAAPFLHAPRHTR